MRSLVGAAQDDFDEEDDVPPPPKKRARKVRPKISRGAPKRGRAGGGFVSRWAGAARSTAARMVLWSGLLAAFFLTVVVAGLFQGGHVSAALGEAKLGADGLMAAAGFTVESVTIEGRAKTAPEEIGRMLGIKRGDLMLYVDVDEARARLEALAWVKSASIRRIWPNRIHVYVEERKPVARWQVDGALAVIDADGRPIADADPGRFAQLPLVVGKGAEASVDELLALIATQPNLKSRVKAAVRVGERRWNLRLANDVEVRLPEEGAEAALAELVRLDRVDNILARDIKAIDLRFPDRFIVKLPQGSPLIAPAPRAPGRET